MCSMFLPIAALVHGRRPLVLAAYDLHVVYHQASGSSYVRVVR
jgi:hypothetical protein